MLNLKKYLAIIVKNITFVVEDTVLGVSQTSKYITY